MRRCFGYGVHRKWAMTHAWRTATSYAGSLPGSRSDEHLLKDDVMRGGIWERIEISTTIEQGKESSRGRADGLGGIPLLLSHAQTNCNSWPAIKVYLKFL